MAGKESRFFGSERQIPDPLAAPSSISGYLARSGPAAPRGSAKPRLGQQTAGWQLLQVRAQPGQTGGWTAFPSRVWRGPVPVGKPPAATSREGPELSARSTRLPEKRAGPGLDPAPSNRTSAVFREGDTSPESFFATRAGPKAKRIAPFPSLLKAGLRLQGRTTTWWAPRGAVGAQPQPPTNSGEQGPGAYRIPIPEHRQSARVRLSANGPGLLPRPGSRSFCFEGSWLQLGSSAVC